jgi:phospholipid/cholesterol/gamma-HCH transport system substrate-binding protein
VVERHYERPRRSWKLLLGAAAAVIGLAALGYYLLRRPILAALATGPEYRTSFSTVGGLRAGDQVRYGGIPVGRTRRVEIDPGDPSKILVVFRIKPSTPMRTDTRASVVDLTNPVTRYVSLKPGTSEAAPLPPGSAVATETGPTIEQTLTNVTVLLARADTLFDAAAPLLQGNFFARLDRTTAQLDRITTAVVRSSPRWAPGLARAAGRLDTVMDRTDRLLATLDSASPDLRASATAAAGLLRDSRTLVAELRNGATQGGGLAELMGNLTSASNNLSRIAAKLDRNPASLIKGQKSIAKTAGPSLDD